jgi:hypothetical protein
MTQRNTARNRNTPATVQRGWTPTTAANSRRLIGHKHATVPNNAVATNRTPLRRAAYALGTYVNGGSTPGRRLGLVAALWTAIAVAFGLAIALAFL